MQDAVIRGVVELAIGCLILVVGWLTGRASSDHPAVGAKILGYSIAFCGAAVVCGVFFPIGIVVLLILQPPAAPEDFWGVVGLALAMIVFGGLLMMEGFRTK